MIPTPQPLAVKRGRVATMLPMLVGLLVLAGTIAAFYFAAVYVKLQGRLLLKACLAGLLLRVWLGLIAILLGKFVSTLAPLPAYALIVLAAFLLTLALGKALYFATTRQALSLAAIIAATQLLALLVMQWAYSGG